jgi:acyl carrier protein
MSETCERLIRCFQAVFPQLTADDTVKASSSIVSDWDSIATVTLAATVEEEFDVRFDPREIEKLDSFQAFLDRLGRA